VRVGATQYTHPAHRTLLIQSWSFDMSQMPAPPSRFLVDTIMDRLRTTPRDSVFLELARRQHCT
jgi:hypothetical protein